MRLLIKLTPQRVSRLLFLLIVFFLPQQFGPHFWPAFAFVDGIRLDYLSPTFYATDVLILLLSFFSLKPTLYSHATKKFLSHKFFIVFLITILIPLFYAKSPEAILLAYIKFAEFIFLGLYIVSQFKKKDLQLFFSVFCTSACIEAFLGSLEFTMQRSVNGLWYFLGERYFTPVSIGQAVVDTGSGVLVRPYATFPHPNVFAFYLFTASVFSTYVSHNSTHKLTRALFLILFIFFQIILFLTLSRIVIFINCVFLFYAYIFLPLKENRKKLRMWLALLVASFFMLLLYTFYFSQRFFNFQLLSASIIPRADLIFISLKILSQNIMFGVGLHNFYFHEAQFQRTLSGSYLQPVHNIFLLIATETGIVGLLIFVYFTIFVFRKRMKANFNVQVFDLRVVFLILFLASIIQGLFDHYFITTQQGLLLIAFILSFSFSVQHFYKLPKVKNTA